MSLIAEKLGAMTKKQFFALMIVVLSTLSASGYVFFIREKMLSEIQMKNENVKLMTNVCSLKNMMSHGQKKYTNTLEVNMLKVLSEFDRFHLKNVVVKEIESTEENHIRLRVFSVSSLASYSRLLALISQARFFGVDEFDVMPSPEHPLFLKIKMKLYGLCNEK